MVIPAKESVVLINNRTACFFFPSRYRSNDFDKNKYPITAADKVNSETNANGPMIGFILSLVKLDA